MSIYMRVRRRGLNMRVRVRVRVDQLKKVGEEVDAMTRWWKRFSHENEIW